MKTIVYNGLFLFLLTLFFSLNGYSQELVKLWDSPRELKTPESVCYYPGEQILFVANINGDASEKDGNGFISIVTTNGKIENLKWVEGLNAPKGMGIHKDKLYVSDIDEVVEISIPNASIVKRYPVEGAKFLNDIAVDNKGVVYISDSHTNKVHTLLKGEISTFISLDAEGTNGLFMDEDQLLVGVSGKILKIDVATKNVTEYIKDTGGGVDGLEKAAEGKYVISDWSGKTHVVTPGADRILLLDTTSEKINSADLEFVPGKNIVVIPTFMDNRISAYTLKFEED